MDEIEQKVKGFIAEGGMRFGADFCSDLAQDENGGVTNVFVSIIPSASFGFALT